MKNFFIIANKAKEEAVKASEKIVEYLEDRGLHATVDNSVFDPVSLKYTDKNLVPKDTECIIVLGGDGTILHATVDLKELSLPILGINLGTLGYLSEADPSDMLDALKRLIDDDFSIMERMMIQGRIFKGDEKYESHSAFNEIVISGSRSMQMISVQIYINDKLLHTYNADGIIVATPTGSTGYNLSAGGPIVNPSADMIIVTPICSHSMDNRSIIFGSDDKIRIVINEGRYGNEQSVEAVFDGSNHVKLKTGDSITITKSDYSIKLLKLKEESFLDTLHNKLKDN